MFLRDIVLYHSMLGLVGLTAKYEASMNGHLLGMADRAAQAVALQAAADEQASLAARNEQQALQDTQQAEVLHQQSAELLATSQEEMVAAAAEEAEAREAASAAAAEQAESEWHEGRAVVQERLAAEELEQGTADAVAAARAEEAVTGDEAAVAVCQMIPLLDVACDVIGTATAVVWQSIAVDEAAKSGIELAAAAAATLEEEREAALAAQAEEEAVRDAAEAAELHEQAAATEERAQEERVEAEELQAEADALLEKAETESALVEEETAVAAADNDEAGELLRESALQGVKACWDGLVVALVGMVSMAFFSLQVLFRFVIPWAWAAHSSLVSSSVTTTTAASDGGGGGGGYYISAKQNLVAAAARHASLLFHHGSVFVVCTTACGDHLGRLAHMSIRARGGALLQFAVLASLVQTVGLHTLPHMHSQTWRKRRRLHDVAKVLWDVVLHVLKHVVLLSLLFLLEITTLWIIFGPGLFSTLRLPLGWLFGMVVVVGLVGTSALHSWLSLLHQQEEDCYDNNNNKIGGVDTIAGSTGEAAMTTSRRLTTLHVDETEDICAERKGQQEEEVALVDEETALLVGSRAEKVTAEMTVVVDRNNKDLSATSTTTTTTFGSIAATHGAWFAEYFLLLRLPLECLVLACLVAVLRHGLPNLSRIWPTAGHALWQAVRPWLVPIAGYTAIGVAGLICIVGTAGHIRRQGWWCPCRNNRGRGTNKESYQAIE